MEGSSAGLLADVKRAAIAGSAFHRSCLQRFQPLMWPDRRDHFRGTVQHPPLWQTRGANKDRKASAESGSSHSLDWKRCKVAQELEHLRRCTARRLCLHMAMNAALAAPLLELFRLRANATAVRPARIQQLSTSGSLLHGEGFLKQLPHQRSACIAPAATERQRTVAPTRRLPALIQLRFEMKSPLRLPCANERLSGRFFRCASLAMEELLHRAAESAISSSNALNSGSKRELRDSYVRSVAAGAMQG